MKSTLILNIALIPLLFFLFTCREPLEEDTTPPTISVSSHSSGQTVGEIVIIKVTTDDNEGISKVELYINNELVLTVTESPFEFIWNTTKLEDGDYILKCISYDTSDNSTPSQPITLKVNNQSFSPSGVNVNSIVFENSGFTITWNKSTETDFESYQLEKSVETQMNDYTVIHTTTDINKISYFDSNGDPLHYQYYRITVTDTFGLEKKGQIFPSSLDPIPNSVDVTSVSYTLTDLTVEWEKSIDSDFKHYKLLYSETENGTNSEIDTYTEINTTTYTTTVFDPTHQNWFWIEVEDTLGQSSIGNGQTSSIDSPPTNIDLNPILYVEDDNGSYIITWSQNNDSDFKSYTLYESMFEDMSGKIATFNTNNLDEISYTITGVKETEARYYQVVVEDHWGLQFVSNIQGGSSDNSSGLTIPTTTTSTIFVKTEPELRAAVQVEKSYVIIENNITLTTSSNYQVEKGVIINGYGSNYGTGGKILYADGTMPSGAFFEMGKDSEIWGIRLIGNNSSGSMGIKVYNKNNVKIKKCEIVGFGNSAISFGGNTSSTYKKGYISSNYIHDNQQSPYGYGIVIDSNSEIYIDNNIFKNNRHHVTSRDLKSSSGIDYLGVRYEASYNTILANSDDEEAHFDVHGNDSYGACSGYGFLWDNGQAGSWIKIHHNQFLGNNDVHVLIRGVPVSTVSSGGGYRIYNNNFGPNKYQIMTCDNLELLQTNVAVLFTDPNLIIGDNFNKYVTINENY